MVLYQFFMRLHRIRSPLTPLNKGGTRIRSFVPLIKGDLGGSEYVQRPIKLVLNSSSFLNWMQRKENSRRDAEKLCKFLDVFGGKLALFTEDV